MSAPRPRLDAETKLARRREALSRYAARHAKKLRTGAKERMRKLRAEPPTQRQKDNKRAAGKKYCEKHRDAINMADALRRAKKCVEQDGVEAYNELVQRPLMAKTQRKHERRAPAPRPKSFTISNAERAALVEEWCMLLWGTEAPLPNPRGPPL
ncbi:hypothetical protein C8R44DRAFT_880791 [Mycena epipterygia]|nr:hypothetical protein C8R44DRAFT_880791 [Mycena epipterygia]